MRNFIGDVLAILAYSAAMFGVVAGLVLILPDHHPTCTDDNPRYQELALQVLERLREGRETPADEMIAAGYCPYDGTWRVCSIRRCRTVKE
jgi:hypothetical protein